MDIDISVHSYRNVWAYWLSCLVPVVWLNILDDGQRYLTLGPTTSSSQSSHLEIELGPR